MGRPNITKVFILLMVVAIFVFAPFPSLAVTKEGEAFIIEIEGPISSGSSTFLSRGIAEAEKRGSNIIIIRLDTPGGLGASMKTMVKTIMNSPIPVVVYVGPRGASAASAGVLITISGHIAAMAPGTNIGAAHPVQADGSDIQETMQEKVVNDMVSYGRGIAQEKGRNADWVEKAIRESVSITAEEALKNNVIDLISEDIDQLLTQIDKREVTVKSGKIELATKDLKKYYFHPRAIDKFLMFISDPTVMAILFSIGLLGLGFEITHPGVIFPGVIGAICLILAFYSMQSLPVNYAGLMLIALAIILFLAEIKVTSYGVLTLGGIVSLTIGSMMFFEDLGLRLTMIIPFIVVISAFFVFIVSLAVRSQIRKPRGGINDLIDDVGVVKEKIDKEGLIFVHGEYWRAESDETIEPGEKAKIVDVKGLILKVVKA